MREKGEPRILTGAELIAIVQEEERKGRELPASDPDHPLGFEYDPEAQIWTVWWGGYEYWFQQSDVSRPDLLLNWIEHLTEKDWRGMTTWKISRLISSVRSKWSDQGTADAT